MKRPALVILVLAAASSFFGWETYRALTAAETPADVPAAGVAPAPRADAAPDNASRGGDLGVQVAVIVTKPLFRPDRQPYFENAVVPQRNYAAELARFSLIGVLLQGEAKKGLVLGASGGRQERWEVGAGESIPGFAVKEVQPDGLTLSSDGREFLLPLYAGGPKGQAAGSLRTEASAGVSGAPVPQAPKAAPPPGGGVPATGAPAAAAASQPAPTPVYVRGGRGTARPNRVYPIDR